MLLSMDVAVAEANRDTVRIFDKGRYLLNSHMDVLKDETNGLTIDQVVSEEYQNAFNRHNGGILNLGISPHTYWLRVTLLYPDQYPNVDSEKQWYLEIDKTLLGVAELYMLQDDGSYNVKSSDLRTDLYEKEVVHVNSVFPMSLYLGEEVTLYMKVRNSSTALYFSLSLWDRSVFLEKVSKEEFVYGLFFGGMLMLMLYNLFVYASVKDDSYYYYVMYLVAVTFYEMLEVGHGVMHLKSIVDVIGKDYVAVTVWLSLWWAIKFFVSFLNVKEEFPRMNTVCNILLWTVFVSAVISYIKNDHNSIVWVSVFAMVFIVGMLSSTVYIWWKGGVHAKFYFFAWSCNGIGFTIYAAMINEIIPATWFTIASAPMGVLLESIVLSFALAERIKIERGKVLKADESVVENMSRYRSVFDNALEGMYRMSVGGVITNVNTSMARVMGFLHVNDVIEKSKEVVLTLYQNQGAQFDEIIEQGVENREFRFERSDGVNVWANHSAKLICDRDGNATHIEGFVVDIREIKEKEVAIKDQLKERISRDMAMAATEEKSKFLSMMSHQIRTSLTAIIGYSESLQDSTLESHQKIECVNTVVSNSQQLLLLINNILDLSKIEAGKFDVAKMPLSIVDIVGEIEQEFVDKCRRKQLEFHVTFHYPLPSMVVGDSFRILQVLRNLCDNALNFCDVGVITLDVTWENEVLIFVIVDTGAGIDKDSMELLFEFGADLGLPLSKKLAGLMAGDITVSSKEEKGNIFRFYVKATLAEDATWIKESRKRAGKKQNDEASESGPDKNKRSKAGKGKSKTIPNLNGVVLLAEDNVVNQALVSRMIKKLGVTVIVANDGVEACELCVSESPDVILMDINMPNRSGIEAVEILRAKGLTMPIYALTAETDKAETDKAIRAGCQGILNKPINRQRLQNTLQQCLKSL